MTDILMKYYNEIYKPGLIKLGFSKKRKIFYRLINNDERLLQCLTLFRSRYGGAFDINIQVSPFCLGKV